MCGRGNFAILARRGPDGLASGELTDAYVHRPLSSRLSGRRRCRLSAHDQSKMEHGLHVAIRDVDYN